MAAVAVRVRPWRPCLPEREGTVDAISYDASVAPVSSESNVVNRLYSFLLSGGDGFASVCEVSLPDALAGAIP